MLSASLNKTFLSLSLYLCLRLLQVPSRVCICLVDGERTDHEEGIEYGVGALLNKLQHACNGVPSNTDAI